jgi:hypothetical protein
MFKKYISLSLAMVAYAILMGHSIIPHHHHDDLQDLKEHHQTNHHHDENEDNKDLSHIFSHFIHSADGFTLIIKHSNSKVFIPLVAVLPNNFSVDEILIPPLLYESRTEFLDCLFSIACTFGLRAPPSL